MTNEKQDALRALDHIKERLDLEGVLSDEAIIEIETIRAALTEAPKVDVDLEKLAEEISLVMCKEDEVDPDSHDLWWAPNRRLNNPERALRILTTHYDLVKKSEG